MKPSEDNTEVAGLDIGKKWLDADLSFGSDPQRFANDEDGFKALIQWLKSHHVRRVGMEATGGYERSVRTALGTEGFEAIVHQPAEVRHFAKFKRIRAKSDKIDAKLIAQATSLHEGNVSPQDPKLIEIAELLTLYEHIANTLAQVRTFAEHLHHSLTKSENKKTIEALAAQKMRIKQKIISMIRAVKSLKARYDLLKTLPGVGEIVAAVLVIRMPELGQLEPGKAASLLGVAPFDRDSGTLKGKRFITGGRARPRSFMYIAALAAKRMDTNFKEFADRLLANGKAPKVVIAAVMRKLIEAANLVLKRNEKWVLKLEKKEQTKQKLQPDTV